MKAILWLLLFLIWTSNARAQSPFYAGKTITVVAGVSGRPKCSEGGDASRPRLQELMNEHKTPESGRRLVPLVMAGSDFGRPIIAPPGVPPDKIKILRDAFNKTMADPELLAEAKRKNFDIAPTPGEELEALAKEVVAQPPEIVERLRKLMSQ